MYLTISQIYLLIFFFSELQIMRVKHLTRLRTNSCFRLNFFYEKFIWIRLFGSNWHSKYLLMCSTDSRQVWNIMIEGMMTNCHFWVNYPFNYGPSMPGVSNPAPGELPSCRFQLQPQSNTPEAANQGVQGYLIITDRCVAAGLELKSAGR